MCKIPNYACECKSLSQCVQRYSSHPRGTMLSLTSHVHFSPTRGMDVRLENTQLHQFTLFGIVHSKIGSGREKHI